MSAPPDAVTDLAAPFLDNARPNHVLHLDLGGNLIRFQTDAAALVDELAAYFREFTTEPPKEARPEITVTALERPAPDMDLPWRVKTPDPGKTKVKEEFVDLADGRAVRKRLTGMVFLFGGGLNLALGPCLENPNQVVNFINNRFIERLLNQGCLLGHAAGVAAHGRGLSLAGFSGMGKSTLALWIMNRGADFVSNDRIMVRREEAGLCMYGVPKHPRINPGTALSNPALAGIVSPEQREACLRLPPEELWSLESKHDALIDACFGPDRFVLRAPMAGLALLNWRRNGGPLVVRRVDIRERPDLLPAFMKETGLFYLPDAPEKRAEAGAGEYAALLSVCQVFEFSGGAHFDQAANVCLEFLETGRLPRA